MSSSKKPNKKSLNSRKQTSSKRGQKKVVPPVSPENVKQTSPEEFNLEQIFTQALQRYKAIEAKQKQEKFKEISHLALIAEEYLSSFVLLGYSLQNEKVVVFNLPTAKDESAMIDLLRTTFLNMVGGQQ